MIGDVLSFISDKLNEYLGSFYDLPETLVALGTPGSEEAEEGKNRLLVSLLNVEREGAAGFTAGYSREGSGRMGKKSPAWHINLVLVIAAVYEEKRYSDGLRMLSVAVRFLQGESGFVLPGGQKFTMELVSLNIQELTNVWSILGGKYYPSVVCKVRMLTFDSAEIRGVTSSVKKPDWKLGS